jgi:hypothetical protein
MVQNNWTVEQTRAQVAAFNAVSERSRCLARPGEHPSPPRRPVLTKRRKKRLFAQLPAADEQDQRIPRLS